LQRRPFDTLRAVSMVERLPRRRLSHGTSETYAKDTQVAEQCANPSILAHSPAPVNCRLRRKPACYGPPESCGTAQRPFPTRGTRPYNPRGRERRPWRSGEIARCPSAQRCGTARRPFPTAGTRTYKPVGRERRPWHSASNLASATVARIIRSLILPDHMP